MALKKASSRKCPVCVGHTPTKIVEVNEALATILADVKATGDLPKASDSRIKLISHQVGLAPHSLAFHIKTCLVDLEIQDQRFQELKDVVELISTAKQEYMAYPSMANATAVNQLMSLFRGLAEDIEGQTDPALTVEFMVESVIGPSNRKMLAAVAEEMKDLRASLLPLLSVNQRPHVDSQIKAAVSRIGTALRETADDSVKAICGYYKVELEAQTRKQAVDSADTKATSAALFANKSKSEEDFVH